MFDYTWHVSFRGYVQGVQLASLGCIHWLCSEIQSLSWRTRVPRDILQGDDCIKKLSRHLRAIHRRHALWISHYSYILYTDLRILNILSSPKQELRSNDVYRTLLLLAYIDQNIQCRLILPRKPCTSRLLLLPAYSVELRMKLWK